MLLYIPPSLLNSHKHKVSKVTGSPPDPTTGAPVYTAQPTQLTQTQGKQGYRFASDPTTGAPVYTALPTQLTQTQGKQGYRFASDPTTGAPVYTALPTQLTQTQGKQGYGFTSRPYNWCSCIYRPAYSTHTNTR